MPRWTRALTVDLGGAWRLNQQEVTVRDRRGGAVAADLQVSVPHRTPGCSVPSVSEQAGCAGEARHFAIAEGSFESPGAIQAGTPGRLWVLEEPSELQAPSENRSYLKPQDQTGADRRA